jgi:glyoxalase family protein
MQLRGIHHLTAVTADARGNHDFYTRVLGMRLVKKTVNQDDVSAYHLFYADGEASPGSDLTFFDWPVARERRGTRSIAETGLRVDGERALAWWKKRLGELDVRHQGITGRDGRRMLAFEDPEGQRLCLIDDGGYGPSHPWPRSPVPAEFQVRGLGPITLSVADLAATDGVLRRVLNMRAAREYEGAGERGAITHVYEMGEGGPQGELHVREEPGVPAAGLGAGGVHHVAFHIPDEAYGEWTDRLKQMRMPTSGPVDRFYFRSLYFREPNGILFEIATEGPGFAADEPMDRLGETLSLPPFLEHRRRSIEANLKPL